MAAIVRRVDMRVLSGVGWPVKKKDRSFLKEADLPAGAVYRCFSGTEELIGAIVEEVLGRILATKESVTVDGQSALPRLVVHVWTETLRNDRLAALLSEGYGAVGEAWTRIVEAYQDAGTLPSDVPAEHVARATMAAAMGFLAQQTLLGPAPAEILRDGVRALTSMRDAADTR